MDERIQIRNEKARGCGKRKSGALYLVDFESDLRPCVKMPAPLSVCPCCGSGIKPARQWTWVEADALLKEARTKECQRCLRASLLQSKTGWVDCSLAMISGTMGRAGLLWVGEKYYPTPQDFMDEAKAQGISRRINFVPHGFNLGETWVLLAHIRAIPPVAEAKEGTPGIFFIYRPLAVEYVCKGDEATEEIDRLIERKITPVFVINPPGGEAKWEDGEEYI